MRLWFKSRKQRELEHQETELDNLRRKAAKNGKSKTGYKSTFSIDDTVPSAVEIKVICWEDLPSREAAMFNKGGG